MGQKKIKEKKAKGSVKERQKKQEAGEYRTGEANEYRIARIKKKKKKRQLEGRIGKKMGGKNKCSTRKENENLLRETEGT